MNLSEIRSLLDKGYAARQISIKSHRQVRFARTGDGSNYLILRFLIKGCKSKQILYYKSVASYSYVQVFTLYVL